jgi:hypothetical protein
VPQARNVRGQASAQRASASLPEFMTLMSSKIYRPIVLFCLLASACGPTRPPSTGLDEAARHLQAARDAGASTYAPLELRGAEERASLGRAAADKHDYEAAAQLAEESQANADLAIAKARLGRAREKVEARTRENAQLRGDLGLGEPGGAQP